MPRCRSRRRWESSPAHKAATKTPAWTCLRRAVPREAGSSQQIHEKIVLAGRPTSLIGAAVFGKDTPFHSRGARRSLEMAGARPTIILVNFIPIPLHLPARSVTRNPEKLAVDALGGGARFLSRTVEMT